MKSTVRRMVTGGYPDCSALDVNSFSLPWPESAYHFELTQESRFASVGD